MSRAKELLRLKTDVDAKRTERDRAKGRTEETQKRMKKDFGVTTLEAAQKLLKKFRRERDQAATTFDEARTTFDEEWSDKLD